ncbi:MAG: 2TM domain-containing protein [Cyanobacteria bacterium RM1_2_2]|nr:2TM domain-containing protein [Cyanobacteria bacterium RM1_2_2]
MSEQYSFAEAQEILNHAASLQQQDIISQEQLLDIALETGISAEILQKSQQVWLDEQKLKQRQAVQHSRRQLGFKLHLIPYLAISILLVFINLKTTPRYFWSVFPILGWGVGVLGHGMCVHSKTVSIHHKV